MRGREAEHPRINISYKMFNPIKNVSLTYNPHPFFVRFPCEMNDPSLSHLYVCISSESCKVLYFSVPSKKQAKKRT